MTNVTDAKKISTILDRKGVALAAAMWPAAWVGNHAAIPTRAVVLAKITSKANVATAVNPDISIWMLKTYSAARPASATATLPFVDQLVVTSARQPKASLHVATKSGRP